MRIAFALAVIAAVVLIGYAVARPGCSLLPVPMPADPYRSGPGGTRAQACAALGRPLPEVRYLPDGLHETALTVGGPGPFGEDNHRFVSVFYAIGTENLVELKSNRGNGIPPGNVGQVNGSVNGTPAIINERAYPADRSGRAFTMVSYMWPNRDVLHVLHVRLDQGITREMADRMAASVR
jgi:hypothetical protein